ncbi:baseplate J/gp47 family protein [Vibrio owensii]|uniref:baseplate assembly protein n=1 Tax=Vibrio owensii TaxID=696485 RepID=UPI00374A00FD
MEGINLALLPPLDVVKQVDYEEILVEVAQKAGIENASPSDPAYRVALAGSYREALLRQDANEQARGVMLAYARGAQLDHIGVTYYQHPDGSPVVRLDGELDDDYRARLQASPEGLSVAGPDEGYKFHARSAHPLVKDVTVGSPAPVEVDLYILSYEGDGVPTDEVINSVTTYLEPRRPLTDWVRVNAASVVRYDVTAQLVLKAGPDPELVRQTAENAAAAYVELKRALKGRVVESGLHAVLTVEGVEEVHLVGWDDVICTKQQAPFCESLTVTIGGYA